MRPNRLADGGGRLAKLGGGSAGGVGDWCEHFPSSREEYSSRARKHALDLGEILEARRSRLETLDDGRERVET